MKIVFPDTQCLPEQQTSGNCTQFGQTQGCILNAWTKAPDCLIYAICIICILLTWYCIFVFVFVFGKTRDQVCMLSVVHISGTCTYYTLRHKKFPSRAFAFAQNENLSNCRRTNYTSHCHLKNKCSMIDTRPNTNYITTFFSCILLKREGILKKMINSFIWTCCLGEWF